MGRRRRSQLAAATESTFGAAALFHLGRGKEAGVEVKLPGSVGPRASVPQLCSPFLVTFRPSPALDSGFIAAGEGTRARPSKSQPDDEATKL